MNKREYLNEELVHWTGRKKNDCEAFEILKAIADEQILRLMPCPNYDDPDLKKKSAMVCFTDIPLKYSREHCKDRFGRFGIAFNKQKMIRYGVNPVFYTTKEHFNNIMNIAKLLERMRDLEKDREWKEELEPYQFKENETVALMKTIEFLQEYSHNSKDDGEYVNYYQREWRLAFNSLPFAGGDQPHLPGMSSVYNKGDKTYFVFKFGAGDVEYLIVPLRYWLKGYKLAQQLGCSLKIYEFSVGL